MNSSVITAVVILGLRGAIAFALSINLDFEQDKRHVLVTTTLVIVLFTLLILGGSTLPLLKVRFSCDFQGRLYVLAKGCCLISLLLFNGVPL